MKNLIIDFDVMRKKYNDIEIEEAVYKSKYLHKTPKDWEGYEKVIDMLSICLNYSLDLEMCTSELITDEFYKDVIVVKDSQIAIVFNCDNTFQAMSLNDFELYELKLESKSMRRRLRDYSSNVGGPPGVAMIIMATGVALVISLSIGYSVLHRTKPEEPKQETTTSDEVVGITYTPVEGTNEMKANLIKHSDLEKPVKDPDIPAARKVTGKAAKELIDKYKDSSKTVVIKVNDDYIYSESEGIFGNKFTGAESLVLLEDGSYYTADSFEDFIEKGQKVPVIKENLNYLLRDIKNNRTGKQIGFCLEEDVQ